MYSSPIAHQSSELSILSCISAFAASTRSMRTFVSGDVSLRGVKNIVPLPMSSQRSWQLDSVSHGLASGSFSIALIWRARDDQIFADDRIGLVNSAHDHADMIVYVNGERINFSQEQFQVRSTYVHFEGGDGDVVHTHATNVNLGFTFQALGMRITSTSISTQDGQLYENGAAGELKVFVNGVRIEDPPNYIIQALDKILISYGDENEAELQALLETVPDSARNLQGVFDNPP